MLRHRSPRAFTLVEVLTVIVIILIIAGWVISAFGPAQTKAARARALAEIKLMEGACENYKADYGDYPREAGVTEGSTTGESPIDPRKHGTPTAANYKSSTLSLYKLLSGDTSADRKIDSTEADNKIYLNFDQKMLGPKKTGTASNVEYIQDPFGNSYGYCTAGAKAEEDFRNTAKAGATRPTGTAGFNATFDLWSTGGKSSSSPTDAERAVWLKNW